MGKCDECIKLMTKVRVGTFCNDCKGVLPYISRESIKLKIEKIKSLEKDSIMEVFGAGRTKSFIDGFNIGIKAALEELKEISDDKE